MACLVNQNCGSCSSAKETEGRMWCWDNGFREIEGMGCLDSNSNYNLQTLLMQGRGVSF